MLKNILRGAEPVSSVLIQDSLNASGAGILRAFIQDPRNITRDLHMHVLCFERPPKYIQNELKLDTSARVQFHDYATDHRGWTKGSPSDDLADLTALKLDDKNRNVVYVDSLSVLVFRIGFDGTYRQLHDLLRRNVELVCVVHEDFLPECLATMTKLVHLFATSLRVSPCGNSSERLVVTARHVKKGGKVIRSVEECTIDADNCVTYHDVAEGKKAVSKEVRVDAIPKELTTFKLDLGDGEKEARDKLVLPYLRREGGGGKVIYEPDDADDWDEEDPDDDLDV